MIEYAIIPVSFRDYNEFVEGLNDYGKEGWIISIMLRKYNNSPLEGVTTIDFICYRKVVA